MLPGVNDHTSERLPGGESSTPRRHPPPLRGNDVNRTGLLEIKRDPEEISGTRQMRRKWDLEASRPTHPLDARLHGETRCDESELAAGLLLAGVSFACHSALLTII